MKNHIVCIALLIALIAPFETHAASSLFNPQAQLALLNATIENLLRLKSSIQSMESPDTEISLRRKILLQIIALSEQDVRDSERTVSKIKKAGPETKLIAQALGAKLDSVQRGYNTLSTEIQQSSSLDEVKGYAKQLLDKRKEAEIVNEQVEAIGAGFENRGVIAIAEARFDKVAFDVRRLELFRLIENGFFDGALESATEHLKNARGAQEELESAIVQAFTPQEEIASSTEDGATETIPVASPELNVSQKPTLDSKEIQILLAASLQEIKETYLIFIDISRMISAAIQ